MNSYVPFSLGITNMQSVRPPHWNVLEKCVYHNTAGLLKEVTGVCLPDATFAATLLLSPEH